MASEILKLCMGKGFLLDKEMLAFLSNMNDEGDSFSEIAKFIRKNYKKL